MTDLVRDVDRVWLESEDGDAFRLADVVHFAVEQRYREDGARVVAIMRYDEGYRDGSASRLPVRFVMATHTDESAARNDLTDRLREAIGIAYYVAGD